MQAGGNIHASCVVLGERGVLVIGPSGSGKTALAFALVERFRANGRFARWVADDQVMLRSSAGRLLGIAPGSIAGMAETYGVGPRRVECESRALVDLVVELVSAEKAPRFQEDGMISLAGCALPLLLLPQKNVASSARAICSWLSG